MRALDDGEGGDTEGDGRVAVRGRAPIVLLALALLVTLVATLLTGAGGDWSGGSAHDAATVAPAPSADAGETASPTGPTRPAPTESTEPTEDPEPRSFSIAMSGDVLLHNGTWDTAAADAARAGEPGLDFSPMFADMRPALRSVDYAVCHLETPLAPPGGPFASYPVFSVPPQVVRGLLATGYDACSTASNHSVDQGAEGVLRTLDTLDRMGMPHFGTAATRKASRTPFVVEIEGVRVALLNYTYGTNGIPVPSDIPWSVPLINPQRIKADAADARRSGAEVVIVGLHFGTEYSEAPDAYQRDVVDRITRSPDIDLVYGHHAHVPLPFDKVHGTWVAYGLGNFIAQQETAIPDTYRGITARFELTERPSGRFAVTDVAFLPTMITPYVSGDPRMRVLDALAALHDPATPAYLRPSLRAAVGAVTGDAESLGADRLGLHPWRSWLG